MSNGNELDLETSIDRLRKIKLELLAIDEEELDQKEKNLLADSLQNCDVAILKLETADLQNLAEEFKAREPELRRAVAKMENDIKVLDNAVDIIKGVSAGLEVAVEIAQLLP